MIFLINELKEEEVQVTRHDSLAHISNGIDWQDIFEGKTKIVDLEGTIYKWDSSKKNEIGTVFGYTLIKTNQKYHTVNVIIKKSKQAENPLDFSFKKK